MFNKKTLENNAEATWKSGIKSSKIRYKIRYKQQCESSYNTLNGAKKMVKFYEEMPECSDVEMFEVIEEERKI